MSEDHPGNLTSAERAELERLRAEVATLRPGDAATSERSRWRSVLSTVLIVIGSILLVPAVAATWLAGVVTDTDRYVDTVSPLVEDAAVQRAVTDRVTDEIVARVDVAELLDEATAELAERDRLPRAALALRGLSEPIASGFESWLHGQVATVVGSDRFRDLWTGANRAAHEQLVNVLTSDDNNGGAVEVENGTVSLELGPVVGAVKERLTARGIGIADRIPEVDAQIEVVHTEHISTARRVFGLIDKAGWWLPVLALLVITAGVLIARDRRKALLGAATGAVVAMLVLALTLALARPIYLDALPPDVSTAAAESVFDQVVSFLKTTLRAVLVIGLVVGAVAFVRGPSTAAAGLRRAFRGLQRRRWVDDRAAAWLRTNKRPLEIGVVVLAAIVLVFWNYPSGAVVLTVALVAMAVVVLIELLAGQPAQAESAGP